jgi:hemoglobin
VTSPIGPDSPPFTRLGHDGAVALAARFYDHMDAHEPALVDVHPNDGQGRVTPKVRENFAAFLVEWLGGPAVYSSVHGHPRLRMRHGRVAIGLDLRDAWLRCMNAALEHPEVDADAREYLRQRFAEVADFLRNRPGP